MATYGDDFCKYLGGDPRLDDRGNCNVSVDSDGVKITLEGTEHQICLPRKSVRGARHEAEYLGDETLDKHSVVLNVRDPEDIVPGGINVRLGFRNEYYAKLFVKRCTEILGVAPF